MDVLEILRAGGYSKIKLVALEGVPDSAYAGPAAANAKALSGCDRDADLETEQTAIPAAVDFRSGRRARAPRRRRGARGRASADRRSPTTRSAPPAIEIGLELTSPRREATDLPPGPDTDASVASPALAEQKAEVKETELPKDTPTETDDPDRVVTPNEFQKAERGGCRRSRRCRRPPRRNRLPRKRRRRQAPMPFRKGRARSLPRRAPAKRARRVRATWQKELVAHLDKHKRYPADALAEERRDRRQLRARPDGSRLSASIVKGSGDTAFDEAALAMVRRSDPVPQPPPLIADEGLSFTLAGDLPRQGAKLSH